MSSDKLLASRKEDHIELAFESRLAAGDLDHRFHYEPMLAGHPEDMDLTKTFLHAQMKFPLWISSMTGGTERARHINQNLAQLCNEFGLGMGLGSCRALLNSDVRLDDFNMRPIIGEDQSLFANLGVAQIEELIETNSFDKINALVEKLNANGLIIHVNPLQEWAQPEGDRFKLPPLDTIKYCCEHLDFPIIVKEVGQGMGPQSLYALMKLPLAAIEFGASGGTNFTQLELNRSEDKSAYKRPLTAVGHTADEMVNSVNQLINDNDIQCRSFIISGGIQDYLHGYYLMEKCQGHAVYGQASAFLKHALNSYDDLRQFFLQQMDGLKMSHAYLRIRK